MKLRIVKRFSKEDGKLLGYALERRIIPFVWKLMSEYQPEAENRVEHDIVWLCELDGKVKTTSVYL